MLNEHAEHLDELKPELLAAFMSDITEVSRALKMITRAERVNMAVLGNQESHVHSHLLPRFPADEPLPHKAPWEDPRPRQKLTSVEEKKFVQELGTILC